MLGRAVAVFALTVLVGACSTAWEDHKELVAQRSAAGNPWGAAQAQKWLVENGSKEAPAAEQGVAADAERLIRLGDLLGEAGQITAALQMYREALSLDATRIEDVLTGIGLLKLPTPRKDALMDEFLQMALTIDPRADLEMESHNQCWTYSVHAIRIAKIWTRKGPKGLERLASYDSQAWIYHASEQRWRPDGEWVSGAGAELQSVDGPPNPLYQAVIDADGGFYTDGEVPPCHSQKWRGPYDGVRRSGYVTRQLPRP